MLKSLFYSDFAALVATKSENKKGFLTSEKAQTSSSEAQLSY